MNRSIARRLVRQGYSAGYTAHPEHKVRPLNYWTRDRVAEDIVCREFGDPVPEDHPLRHVVLEMEDCE